MQKSELIRRLQEKKSELQTSIPDTITELTSLREN